MDEYTLLGLASLLFFYVRPFIYGTAVLAGLVTMICKPRTTKVLGLSFALSSASLVLECVAQIVLKTEGDQAYVDFSSSMGLIQFALGIGAIVCLCIFIHKNYGKKLIYLPLLLIPLAEAVVTMITTITLGQTLSSFALGYGVSIAGVVISFIFGAVTSLIVIKAFFDNRDEEEVIPKAWLCKVIALVWSLIEAVLLTVIYASAMQSGISGQADMLRMLITVVTSIVSLILPLYVMIKAITAGVKGEG